MRHRKPEQVNTPVPAEPAMPEFTLEEILEEFGSKPSAPAEKAPVKPVPQAERESAEVPSPLPSKTEAAENASSVPDKPMPRAPEPEKAAAPSAPPQHPTERAEQTAPRASVWQPKPPVQPPLPGRKKEEPEAPRASRKRPAPVKVAPEAPPPPTAQELLEKYRTALGSTGLRLGLTGFLCVMNFLLLLCGAYFPAVMQRLPAGLPVWLSAGLLVLSLLLAFEVVIRGLRDLFRLRINLFTLGTLAVILCVADAFVSKTSYCAPGNLLLYFLFRALVLQRRGMFSTLHTVCSIEHPMGICRISGLEDSALRCDAGDRAIFCGELEQPDAAQTLFCIYSTILLAGTLAAAVIFARSGHTSFLHGWTLLLLGATPCAGLLSFARPFHVLAKRLSEIQGALCGWYGAGIFSGRHTILLRDGDLFPVEGIRSNGMKLYASYPAAKVIGYALAALQTCESPLTPVFEALLEAQFGKHFQAASHRIYDAGGIGAEIAGDIVLVGSLSFMQSMGVHMPAGTKVRLAVYVSIGGELAGVFALKYKPTRSARLGLRAVLAKSKLNVVLATQDFLITPELIAAKYEIPTQRLVFPPYSARLRYASAELGSTTWQGALVAKDTFGTFASTVAAGQSLYSATLTLTILNLAAGFFGVILCALLLSWNAGGTASPLHIALFQVLWVILSEFISFILLLL